MKFRSICAAGTISLLAATGGVFAATAAHATGAVNGAVLGIHSSGAVYAGSGSVVTGVTTPNGTITYTVDVLNKGPVQGQFLLRISSPQPGETTTLAAGTLITTPLAQSPSGYFTAPINPGKSAIYTLKVKAGPTVTQTSRYFDQVLLYNTDGVFLDSVSAETEFRATSGPFIDDVYVSGNAGGPVISEPNLFFADYAAQPIKPAHFATYTVKLRNDSQTPGALRVGGGSFSPCGGSDPGYPITIKVGTADVTPAVLAGTYMTASLAHTQSVTFTVLVAYPSPPTPGCFQGDSYIIVFGPDNSATQVSMLTPLAQA